MGEIKNRNGERELFMRRNLDLEQLTATQELMRRNGSRLIGDTGSIVSAIFIYL